MNLIVTGAPGWLGDSVLEALPAHAQVRCLVHDTIPEAAAASWRKGKIAVAELVRGNLADAGTRAALLSDAAGSTLLHSAAVIHPHRTRDWYAINCDATLDLAREARAAGVLRFVFVSSNAAQGAAGSPSDILVESGPCKPLSHYGKSKWMAEQGLMALHEPGRFEVVVARPCMFYGPPIPQRHVDIFRRIQAGRLPMVGDGRYARSLSYIDDLVQGILLCLTHPAAPGNTFYLCDAQPYTTREVCEAMAAALGVPARFFPLPVASAKLAYAVDRLVSATGFYSMNFHLLGEADWNVGCSSERAAEMLGYRTTVDVWEGYRRAVAWCRKRKLI